MTHKILKGDWLRRLFFLLYVIVAAATFRHTSLGFASIEGGSVVWGGLSALAIDAGMMLSASGLRKARTPALVLGLVISAAASTFTQLLYATFSAQAVTVAPGAAWMGDYAAAIIDARVLILPALLPLLSVVYAFAAKGERVATPDADELARQLATIKEPGDRARLVWAASDNGMKPAQVAELAKCHPSTASRVKPK